MENFKIQLKFKVKPKEWYAKRGKKGLRMEQENKSLERNKIRSEITQVAHAHHETKLAILPQVQSPIPFSDSPIDQAAETAAVYMYASYYHRRRRLPVLPLNYFALFPPGTPPPRPLTRPTDTPAVSRARGARRPVSCCRSGARPAWGWSRRTPAG